MGSFGAVVALILLLVVSPSLIYADATISICSATGFTSLRDCARSCFDHGECGTLAVIISCWDNDEAWNSCYCRSDLIPVAESYLSSCVASACSSNTRDIGMAINLYTEYCSSTAAIPPPITLYSTATQDSGPVTSQPYVVVETVTVINPTASSSANPPSSPGITSSAAPSSLNITTPSVSLAPSSSFTSTLYETIAGGDSTPSSGGSGSGGGGLSRSDKIALGVGLSVPLAALLVALYTCVSRRYSN